MNRQQEHFLHHLRYHYPARFTTQQLATRNRTGVKRTERSMCELKEQGLVGRTPQGWIALPPKQGDA